MTSSLIHTDTNNSGVEVTKATEVTSTPDVTTTQESTSSANTDVVKSEDPVDMELPAADEITPEEKLLITPDTDGIINVDLSPIRKKRICINGDLDKMIELNISDINIVSRLSTALTKLRTLQSNATDKIGYYGDDEESLTKLGQDLTAIDKEMRDLVDFIFDSKVSDVCASDGSMYDVFRGAFRYEHIIESLMKLYEVNIRSEYGAMRTKVSKHTSKYTKKR